MLKQEFEKLVGVEVSPSDYELIEKIYTFHPANFDKTAVAELYKMGGISLIFDLEVAADTMKALNEEKRQLQSRLTEITDKERYYKTLYKSKYNEA